MPENPTSPSDCWRVSASWVLDLDQYNEWMSEEDYEVDEQGRKKVHKLRLSVEDFMSSSNDDKGKAKQPKAKRKRSPSPPPKGGKRKRFDKTLKYIIFYLQYIYKVVGLRPYFKKNPGVLRVKKKKISQEIWKIHCQSLILQK